MNKIHRTVWNEARQCFVVASETTKSKGKASSTRSALAPAVGTALLALGALGGVDASAQVECSTTNFPLVVNTQTIPSSETAQGCVLNSSIRTLIVDSGGSVVNLSNGPININANITGTNTGGITNSGSILATNGQSVLVNNNGITLTGNILNNAGGLMQGDTGIYLVSNSAIVGSIQNAGTIKGTVGFSIVLDTASISQGITNSGTLQGANGNRAIELRGASTLDGGLTNTGVITAGISGFAIYVGADSTISNSTAAAINSGGTGPVGTITGTLFNAGTISGTFANSSTVRVGDQTVPMNGIQNTGTITSTLGNALQTSKISLTGSITNSKVITGRARGLYLSSTNIAGSVQNVDPGVISATNATVGIAGIDVSSSNITGGITNSGTISAAGLRPSVRVVGSSTANIVVNGSNTAKFIGPVESIGAMSVASGATYTADNGNQFTVSGFTTAGTLGVAAGGTATVTGNYTQNSTGTFRVNATDASTYGKLTVTGTATLPTVTMLIDVATGDVSGGCAGITNGTTMQGVITSSGTMNSPTAYSVSATPSCTGIAFTAVKATATRIDLVASTAFVNTAPTFVGSTTTFTLAQGASATDMTGLLHASDSDSSQTLTWTQSTGPSHGALSISGATTASGSADIAAPVSSITYTPVASYVGADSFVVQVSDGTGSALRTLTGTIGSARTVTVTPLTLNSMTAGTPFVSQTFTGSGGYGAYVCDITAGALPTGLALSSGCVLSGTPTTAASYNFTVRVRDSSTGTGPFAGTLPYSSVTVAPANSAPTYVGATTTLTVAQGAAATDVKALLHASDSNASQTLTWTQTAAPTHGTLSGLPATASTGLSGSSDITPGGTITYQPTAGYAGADSFTVQVSDGTANASRTINVTVGAPTVTINALTLNAMTAGTAFVSQSFSGTGGTGPYVYAVSAGALPAGLSLNTTTGALTGTPTAAGAYNFTIRATDSSTGTGAPFSGTQAFSGTVSAATVTLNALTLNTMTVSTAFVSQSFSGAGGTGPYTYTVSAGTLPAGLSLNTSTGALTGTPTTAGAYSFTIQATDSSTGTGAPFSGTLAFTGTVLPATATQTNIPTSSTGVTATLAAAGCTGINSAVFVTAPAGAPANTTFPFGLLDFRLTGCSGGSVSVTVTYSQNLPANAVFYKENNGSYAVYPTTAITANSVTFNLTDGGAGDADGVADGNIHDPSGVGVAAAVAGAPTSIPTLSEWGLIFLSSLMAMFGLKHTRRGRASR